MHEVGLCEGVVDAVRRRAGGRPVAAVRVQVGVLHRVDDESFRQAFSMVAAGTEAAGAEVDVVSVPVRARCGACGAALESGDPLVLCPTCDSADLDVSSGYELVLESLTYRAAPTGAADGA
ncbi:MAG: hydrogenase maturation nickel metallochaperone HypA [Acidimicrobiales bacterium]